MNASKITEYLWKVIQVLLSVSLLNYAREEYEKIVMIISTFSPNNNIIIIEIVYAASCVAVWVSNNNI